MLQNIPVKLEDLKRHREEYIKTLNKDKKNVSKLDKLAVWITEHVGSMRFFVIIFIWTALWLG